jgi:predicted  nucleic acid-binding Zn-ribbon protein
VNEFHLLLANEIEHLQQNQSKLQDEVQLLKQTIQEERNERSGEVQHLNQKFEDTLAIYKQCNESKVGLQFYLSFI